MTPKFISDAQIEARVAEIWRQHALAPAFDEEKLLDDLGLGLVWESMEDEAGGRILGQLILGEQLVVLNQRHLHDLEANDGRLRRFTIAHEIGHSVLHAASLVGEPLFDGRRTWCRDGSRDPIERQAEKFAASLLAPRDVLRAHVPEGPWTGWQPVYRLADRFRMNVTPMRIRLEQLNWMHIDDSGQPSAGSGPRPGQDVLF